MNKLRIHSSENADPLVDQSGFCRHTLPNNLMSSQHSQLLVPLQALLRKHRSTNSPKNDIVTTKNVIPVKNSNITQHIDSTRMVASNGLVFHGQSPVLHHQPVGPPDYKTAVLEIQRRNNLIKSSIITNGHHTNFNDNFVRNGGSYDLPLNLTNLYPHSRLPQSGGHVNPTSGLTSPFSDIRQSSQHGYQQQSHTISTNKNNQPSMRSKQPENLPYPGFNETPTQSFVRQPLGHPEQQHQHRPPQDRSALFKSASKPRQQGQLESNVRSIDNSNSNSRHHLHHPPNNNASQLNPTKSTNIIPPTRRLDLSSSSNSSPHSTIDSKKGRSRSSSQSTPGKSAFAIKRSDDAPVTLQGWLYKQGSDGLMLWKKRWFVLSEFCLFYYKGPDEERCAGSILLPSYKISPVFKEDGVYKKFAFKAEHQNMRTYFFAAESREAMNQWMNALSLASICQQEHNLKFNGNHDSNGPKLLSPSLKSNRPIPRENYSQTMIVQHHYPPAVHQMYSPSGDAYKYHPKSRQSLRMDSSEAEDESSSSKQPLYANAPPKPKRMNPSRERESPSPERRVYQVNEENPTLVTAMYQQPRAGVHRAHVIDENSQQGYRQRSVPERRTPEVYGRAANFEIHQLKRPVEHHLQARQFEDFYNGNNFYEPQHGTLSNQPQYLPPNHQYQNAQQFPGYNNSSKIHPDFSRAHHNQHFHHQAQTIPTNNFYNAQIQQFQQERNTRTSRQNGHPDRVPRPHSADFLELEPSKIEEIAPPYRGQAIISRHPNKSYNNQPPRPKSSIEQRIPSELRHQMLDHQNGDKSLFRLYPTTPQPRRHNMNNTNGNQYYQHPQHQIDSRNRNFNPQTPRPPPLVHRRALSASRDKTYADPYNMATDNTNEEVQLYFPTPTPTPRRASQTPLMTYQNVPTPNLSRTMQQRLESVTPSRLVSDLIEEQNRLKLADETNGEFRRSSSARLHRNKQNHPEFFEQLQFGSDETKKKEQREESMKRLLEWKQRMLQSPLTRKSSRNTSRTQTPTNSSSPVPSLTNNDNGRQKSIFDQDRNGETNKSHPISSSAAQTPAESRRVSRKGSGASRSSRNRSSPRTQNRLSTSSSEEDVSESSRDSRQHQRRKSGSGFTPPKKDAVNSKPRKFHGNLLDLTAQDLLGKSHEELVLMLIHLRRQSAALNEAIEATKEELQNSPSLKTLNSEDDDSGGSDQKRAAVQDLRMHIKELEDKRARGLPIISLVDNMVKLGSLYRGPQDAPLSHRVRNLPTDNIQRNGDFYLKQASKQRRGEIQELLDRSLNLVNKTVNSDLSVSKTESNKIMNQQQTLVKELDNVRQQLQQSQKKLDHVAMKHSSWENDVLTLRQQLQTSASRDMQYGLGQSAGTLNIESELAHVHHQGSELQRKRTLLSREIDALTQKQDALTSEIRRTPNVSSFGDSGGSSALKKWTTGIVDTSLDSIASLDQSVADELDMKNDKSMPINVSRKLNNGMEEEDQGYKTFQQFSNNSYESNSSGNQSEYDPQSNKRVEGNGDNNGNTDDLMVNLTLGDISEADDRVKKFFRILPKDNIKEIKTVRMVKRDSKERSISKTGNWIEDEDADQFEESILEEDPPPPPLPRGSFQNLHDFLNPTGNQQTFGSLPRTISGRIRYSEMDNDNNIVDGSPGSKTSTLPRTNFKLGEYYKQKYTKDTEKSPGTGVSAHERLFGSSREASLSPPSSPEKSLSSGRNSSTSPVTSPIFKSAAARAIIEEVGKTWTGSVRKRDKKRSLTITSSHPAVMEALNEHQQLLLRGSNRSRDDLDMERILRPRGHNTPDVIRSALDKNDTNETTIDNLFGAPDKIVIPERYVPESDVDNQTPEERKVRLKKVDSIRRMLAGQHSSGENSHEGDKETITEERKQREQLLELNHLIAKQVMEKTRLAAGKSQPN